MNDMKIPIFGFQLHSDTSFMLKKIAIINNQKTFKQQKEKMCEVFHKSFINNIKETLFLNNI